MKPLVTCAEASRLDARISADYSIPPLLLMENAAAGLFRAICPLVDQVRSETAAAATCSTVNIVASGNVKAEEPADRLDILVLAGKGNNAGDALAMLRHARFSGIRRVGAILAQSELSGLAEAQLVSLRAMGLPLLSWEDDRFMAESLLKKALILVDGISGTGLRGALLGASRDLVLAANDSGRPIAAFDIPSGLSDDFDPRFPLIKARWTLSIEPRKTALFFPAVREFVGSIIPIEGVFPVDSTFEAQAQLLEEKDLERFFPRPKESSHKGTRGRLGILAGSSGMIGAAALATRSAMASSAGIVTLFACREIYEDLSGPSGPLLLGSAIVRPEDSLAAQLGNLDLLVLGPGWGIATDHKTRASRLKILGLAFESDLPLVLDADAIRLLPELGIGRRNADRPLILTPHPGEFEALEGIAPEALLSNPVFPLSRAADRIGGVIVLKSHVTWIMGTGQNLRVFDGMNAALATAGSGDVLAGLVGGFLASGLESPIDAASGAVIAHALAGRRARKKFGWFDAFGLAAEAAVLLGDDHDATRY